MKKDRTKRMYMNLEAGNILSYKEMLKEAAELYDCGDCCNVVPLSEYYCEVIEESPLRCIRLS